MPLLAGRDSKRSCSEFGIPQISCSIEDVSMRLGDDRGCLFGCTCSFQVPGFQQPISTDSYA